MGPGPFFSFMRRTVTKVAYYSMIMLSRGEFHVCTGRVAVFRLWNSLMTWFLIFMKMYLLVQTLLGDTHPDMIPYTVFSYKKKERPHSVTSHLPDQRWSPQLEDRGCVNVLSAHGCRTTQWLGGGGVAIMENLEETSKNTCSSAASRITNLTRSHLGLRRVSEVTIQSPGA
jgi:hypothetical protein